MIWLNLSKMGVIKNHLQFSLLRPKYNSWWFGWLFQFALYSPYVYIDNDAVVYGLLALRYVDLRSQMFDAERLMDQAIDKYAFMRDAYLQHRNYLISGGEQDNGALYVEDEAAEQKQRLKSVVIMLMSKAIKGFDCYIGLIFNHYSD